MDISRPVNRTVKTDIAGSVVVTPSGGSTGTPIVAADLTNGFAPITVNFAAGETSKQATFAVADDTAVEGTETYRLTMSNPLPSGTFSEGAFVEGTVADNDAAPPPNPNIYGPTSTTNTNNPDGSLQSVGAIGKYKIAGTLKGGGWEIRVGATEPDGAPAFLFGSIDTGGAPTHYTGYSIAESGASSINNAWNFTAGGDTTNGAPFEVVIDRDLAKATVTIGGVTKTQSIPTDTVGQYWGVKQGNGQPAQSITVTAI